MTESETIPVTIELPEWKLTLGKAERWSACDQPAVTSRLDKLTLDVPCRGFGVIERCIFENAIVIGYDEVRQEYVDAEAFEYVLGKDIRPLGRPLRPIVRAACRWQLFLAYSGYVPPGMRSGEEYIVRGRFEGVGIVP